jgi:hypothetical protein
VRSTGFENTIDMVRGWRDSKLEASTTSNLVLFKIVQCEIKLEHTEAEEQYLTEQVKFGMKLFPARVMVLPEYPAGNNGTKVVGVATTVNAFDNIAYDACSELKSAIQIERALEIGADAEITKINDELFT